MGTFQSKRNIACTQDDFYSGRCVRKIDETEVVFAGLLQTQWSGGLTQEVTLELRLKDSHLREGSSEFAGRGKSKCKGPVVD
jgi:hypothetical protein